AAAFPQPSADSRQTHGRIANTQSPRLSFVKSAPRTSGLPSEKTDRDYAYAQLQRQAAEGNVATVNEIVEHLVKVRHDKPNSVHYVALILANVNAEEGSVDAIKVLLEEMKQDGIPINSTVYHALLKVVLLS